MRTDILKASLLAVFAASLLGATTYLLSQPIAKEEHKLTATLDTFTPKGGQGSTMVSSPYFHNENISIYALIKDESNTPLTNTSVVFQIYGPPGRNITFSETIVTNASGIAVVNLNPQRFKQDDIETIIGVWSVVATAQPVSGEQVVDSLVFEVEQPPSPYVDVYTERGGQGLNIPVSQPYKPNDTVTLYAQVSDGISPLWGSGVAFFVFQLTENANTTILARTAWSNASGIASLLPPFRLHPDPLISVGSWQVLAKVEIKGQVYEDTLTFECTTPD